MLSHYHPYYAPSLLKFLKIFIAQVLRKKLHRNPAGYSTSGPPDKNKSASDKEEEEEGVDVHVPPASMDSWMNMTCCLPRQVRLYSLVFLYSSTSICLSMCRFLAPFLIRFLPPLLIRFLVQFLIRFLAPFLPPFLAPFLIRFLALFLIRFLAPFLILAPATLPAPTLRWDRIARRVRAGSRHPILRCPFFRSWASKYARSHCSKISPVYQIFICAIIWLEKRLFDVWKVQLFFQWYIFIYVTSFCNGLLIRSLWAMRTFIRTYSVRAVDWSHTIWMCVPDDSSFRLSPLSNTLDHGVLKMLLCIRVVLPLLMPTQM